MQEIKDMEKMAAEFHYKIDPMSGFKAGDFVYRKKSANGVYPWDFGEGPHKVAAAENGHLNFEFATGWYLHHNFERMHEDPCPDCGQQLLPQPRGGVECSNSECDYWFCY